MDFNTIDGETLGRRRDRRVSFAETTAVRFFDRDDSSGTPPKSDSSSRLSPHSDSGCDDSSRDSREDGDDLDDDDQEYEDGLAVPPVRFIRGMIDSSPGSASAASVASNDDDNFFGPVSRSFMDSGGASDSGMSEDINNVTNDITLDSTAFSLHFRNIGGDDRSANSAGSLLMTPSGDNKTPFVRGSINELSGANDHSANLADSLLITPSVDNKPPFVRGSIDELSGANDTAGKLRFSAGMSSAGLGDFSSVANYSSEYDYGGLSATLNDILRKVDDSMNPISPVSCPIDVQMDPKGDGARLLAAEVCHPTDASVEQNADGAKPPTGKDPHSIDFSIYKDGDAGKPLSEEVARPIDVSIDKNGDGARSLMGEVSHPIDVSIDENGDSAKPPAGDVSHPVDVSMDQNGDGAKPLTGEDSHPVHFSIDENYNGAKSLIEGISGPVDVLMNQNGDGVKILKGMDPHPIDGSIDENSDRAKLVTGEVSLPVDVSMVETGAKLVQREEFHPIDVFIDKNSDVSKLVMGEVSFPVDVPKVQNVYGAKLPQMEDSHPTDVSIDRNDNDAKLVTGEVSHAIDASMEKNVNSNEFQMFGTCAFDDKPANEKDEDHSEDMHVDFCSNTIPQVESAIALSSPLTTVQHPERKLPMVTPKVALVNEETSPHTKMAPLGETRQSPYIMSELFKQSERISAIEESILREFPKGSIASTRLDFENENLPPSHPPVEKVISNQQFDLEERKRKLQQFLGSIEDHPAKRAKPLAYESQEHDGHPQNCSLDWSKLAEDMSEITRLSLSPSIQKLTVQELDLLSGMMEKLQLSRKYERLSAFLINCDSADQRQQRLADARSLHDKLLYEKAKLELKRLKLNKLCSKAELARKRVQECHLLKSRISDLCCSSSKEAYKEHDCFPTNSISLTQDEQDRLISKRQALKAIQQKIINLGAAFRVSCKIVDLSCDDIINIAKEHLKLKNTHSIVQGDVKLWKLHDIVKQDKWWEIVLDYNLLFQRFTLGISKSGGILVNTTLNKAKILQETSLLLGNVIHVLHEVQAAKRELFNLISANFNCKLSNTNMLELQLCFVNFKRGRKVVLSLDLSDLRFAMYPSVSSELHIEIDATMTTFDEVLLKEIKALVQRLPTGRLMVLRLCREVSQYVHSSYK
ncbi:uncharacterized protein LOC144564471 isoform X2 [Carex rostrata]